MSMINVDLLNGDCDNPERLHIWGIRLHIMYSNHSLFDLMRSQDHASHSLIIPKVKMSPNLSVVDDTHVFMGIG